MLVGIQDEILRLNSIGILKYLLVDKTTKANIIWGTDAYEKIGVEYKSNREIMIHLITGKNSNIIKNRARKELEQQYERTRKHAEVFTPFDICHKMISNLDAEWFGKTDAFLNLNEHNNKVIFPKRKKWQQYIDSRRLEITCGEAPYLVTRYDVANGEIIPLENRQGILDRKLRIANENTNVETDWLKWTLRAFQSTYGYEFQGDNLLIARVNMLVTFEEYLEAKWGRKPSMKEYKIITNIIVWNIWQMDGLSGAIPYSKEKSKFQEFNLFEQNYNEDALTKHKPCCRIYDWRRDNSLRYLDVNTGGRNMKFDFIIGNPPYQDEMQDTSDNPIYNLFMDSAYSISSAVELITPARFLFNAGKTPKEWNRKMLNDEHFKVLDYKINSTEVFMNADIKGGIAITYYDTRKRFGAIQTFTVYKELDSILKKVRIKANKYLSDYVFSPESYKFTEKIYIEHPNIRKMKIFVKGKEKNLISEGHDYDLTTNIFEKLENIIFFNDKPKDLDEYIQIMGRQQNNRKLMYIKRKYVEKHDNLLKYKVILPKSNGSGMIGEVLSTPLIGEPLIGHTQTFISIGAFENENEAQALLKYIKTKFARTLLGILKVTQDNKKGVWKYVPMQDFTDNSDIDWSKSISEIDQQLYKKYILDEKEIEFIETHIKEMA